MNTIDEQTEMMLFDLLEGNLSEQEATQLLNKIEANSILSKEYRLLKATYLKPDTELLFEDKAALYKSASIVPFYKRMSFRYAAAVAILLLAGGVLWKFSGQNTNTVTVNTLPTSIIKPIPGKDLKTETTQHPMLPGTIVHKTLPKNTQKSTIKPVLSPEKKQPFFLSQDTGHTIAVAKLDQVPKSRVLPSLISDTSFLQDYQLVFDNENGKPQTITKRRSLGYRLLNSSRYMLANLSLPDIELRKKGSKLKLEVFTYDKNTIANLEY